MPLNKLTDHTSHLLTIDRLNVSFGRRDESMQTVLEDVSFSIEQGEKLALVGESGSGKSVTALSILQLHERANTRYQGQITFSGENLLNKTEAQMRTVRGKSITMIFQEPMSALNPVYPIGEQLIEPLMLHEGLNRAQARERMIELMDRTGLPEPHKRIDAFPHMLSGGQRQRVMIAMALACQPELLIADEPTTALDVTIQAQILELLDELQQEFGMSILLITHDLNIVHRFADRICVMKNGRIVEQGTVDHLFTDPKQDYTRNLLNSRPQRLIDDREVDRLSKQDCLYEAREIRCYFPIKAGFFRRKIGDVRAVDNVNLHIQPGETLGIVGESGSGKTTLGMCLLRLQECDGKIIFNQQNLQQLGRREIRPLRRFFQVVFQDPYSSLSPRMSIEQILREGLNIHFPEQTAAQHRKRILQVMQEVGLETDMLKRYPHEFSGGQRQRIAIARAVVLEPKLIMLDEPTSALDVSVQKQVLELLTQLQKTHGISYLFITHDLAVIRAMAHRMMVMQNGVIVEEGETEGLFNAPQQAYTRKLLHASLLKPLSGT